MISSIYRLPLMVDIILRGYLWPGSGSAASSGGAAFGTSAIGKAAIAYYIDDKNLEDAKEEFEKEKNNFGGL